MATSADAGSRRESHRSRSAAAETPLPVHCGSLLAVVKEVLPAAWWVAEPTLLSLLHRHGVDKAERRDFSSFFRANPGLLDRMMSGAGDAAKGHECIFINLSQHGAEARVRHYYKLASSTDALRYPSPAAQPAATREGKSRRRRTLSARLIDDFNTEYHAPPPPPPPLLLGSSSNFFETDEPVAPKARRRVRSLSPRPSSTSAGSYSKFGDKQVRPTFPQAQCARLFSKHNH